MLAVDYYRCRGYGVLARCNRFIDRARNLIALAKSMDALMPEMHSVISSVVADCVSQGK